MTQRRTVDAMASEAASDGSQEIILPSLPEIPALGSVISMGSATSGPSKPSPKKPKRPRSPPLAELVRDPPPLWQRPAGVPVVDSESGPFGCHRRKQFAMPPQRQGGVFDVMLGEDVFAAAEATRQPTEDSRADAASSCGRDGCDSYTAGFGARRDAEWRKYQKRQRINNNVMHTSIS